MLPKADIVAWRRFAPWINDAQVEQDLIISRALVAFSEMYLQEITQQPEDTEILASLTTLKEYREFARTATIQKWKDSFVHEVIYALRFGVKSENERLTLHSRPIKSSTSV